MKHHLREAPTAFNYGTMVADGGSFLFFGNQRVPTILSLPNI